MEQQNERALARVLRKLSALRATFSDQEQAILDALIVRAEPEVEAHARHPGMDADRRMPEPDDVQAHARTPGLGADRRMPEPDDVQAHARRPEPEADVDAAARVRIRARTVFFDPATGEYRVR